MMKKKLPNLLIPRSRGDTHTGTESRTNTNTTSTLSTVMKTSTRSQKKGSKIATNSNSTVLHRSPPSIQRGVSKSLSPQSSSRKQQSGHRRLLSGDSASAANVMRNSAGSNGGITPQKLFSRKDGKSRLMYRTRSSGSMIDKRKNGNGNGNLDSLLSGVSTSAHGDERRNDSNTSTNNIASYVNHQNSSTDNVYHGTTTTTTTDTERAIVQTISSDSSLSDDELSTATQEPEYIHNIDSGISLDHDYAYQNNNNVRAPGSSVASPSRIGNIHVQADIGTSNRFTCYVYKRKAGFRGKLKKSYAVASERANTFGHTLAHKAKYIHQGHMDFWKNGIHKFGGNNAHDLSNSTALTNSMDINMNMDHPDTDTDADAYADQKQDPGSANVKMWERRRLVLEGRLLMYYHEDAGLDQEDTGTDETIPTTALNSAQQSLALQRLKYKLNEFAEHANLKQSSQSSAINAPRGVIDIIASHATASIVPISPHSHAPTPYCLAIMVKSEMKWTLCFDSEQEVTRWLGFFTNVALRQSLTRYKKYNGKDFESGQLCLENGIATQKKRNVKAINRSVEPGHNHTNAVKINEQSYRTKDSSTRRERSGSNSMRSDSQLEVDKNNPSNSVRNTLFSRVTSLQDSDTCRVFALVNSVFLYLFIVVEEAASLSHVLAFAVINTCTWMHFKWCGKSSAVRTDSSPNDTGNATERDVSDGLDYNTDHDSPIKRQITVSSSFIETRRTADDDDESYTYRPPAGISTVRVNSINEKPDRQDGERKTTWMSANPSIIDLRGHDYLTSKLKIPSPTSLYELVDVDTFDANEHMTDVGQRFSIPDYDYGDAGHWCAPDTLIISFALPTSPPKLRSGPDGKGYVVCGYFRIRSDVRKTLDIISNPKYDEEKRESMLRELFPDSNKKMLVNGVKLWEKWCTTAKVDPEMMKRLKFVPRGENLKELGVPSWICRYNGKPMLIKRPGETSFIFSHPDERTMEIDINLHPLPFMFKQAMTYLKEHYFPKMIMTFGFVIEGREEEELPEVLLGNPIQLPFVNPNLIMPADEVFAN